VFLGSMRQTQLLGITSDTDDLMNTRVHEWTHTFGLNLVSKTPPTTTANVQAILSVMRQAQLMGNEEVNNAGPCIPCLFSGAIEAPSGGVILADANICPGPTPAPTRPPVEPDAPYTEHVAITGQDETDGLPSGLGSGTDGKQIGAISVGMDVQVQGIGGISHFTKVSGTYSMTGSVSGDCVGSGQADGVISTIGADARSLANGDGTVSVTPFAGTITANFSFPQTCSAQDDVPPYAISTTTYPLQILFNASCDVSSGKGSYTCEDGLGGPWSIVFTR
jgi:hypothetical protein